MQGPELSGLPSFLWGGAEGGGGVSCGSRLVHTPIVLALNILAGMIILASFHLSLPKTSFC